MKTSNVVACNISNHALWRGNKSFRRAVPSTEYLPNSHIAMSSRPTGHVNGHDSVISQLLNLSWDSNLMNFKNLHLI